MSTIQDVAQKAGVSVSTVYKVFSDSYKTRDEIRERVLKACDELNYSHHSIIKKRKLLGMMFSEVTNPFTNTLMQMIIDELGDEYDIVTLFSNEDLTREKQNITCLEQMKVDALIFATFSNQEYPEINKMISDGKPVIQFFMQTHPGADAILFDDELGTYQAVKYLIQNGHKDILMLYKYRIGFPQRSNGYRKAFEEAGLEDADALRDTIANVNGYKGLTGTITMDPETHMPKDMSMFMYTYDNQTPVMLGEFGI